MLDPRKARAPVDPIWRLVAERSLQRTVTDWLDLQIQLQTNDGAVVAMMVLARNEAIDAMVDLAHADPEDPKVIRELQNKVTCFEVLVHLARKVMEDGHMNQDLLKEETNRDINQYVDPEGRYEADELGLVTEENNDA